MASASRPVTKEEKLRTAELALAIITYWVTHPEEFKKKIEGVNSEVTRSLGDMQSPN